MPKKSRSPHHFSFLSPLMGAFCLLVSQLAHSATINGTVTDNDSGAGIAGVTVVISDMDQPWYQRSVAEVTTNTSGEYSATVSIDPGETLTLVVEAAGPNHGPARHGGSAGNGCYFGCGGLDGALSVSESDTLTNVDITLEEGGRFSGIVTDASDGSPIGNAFVEPVRPDNVALRFSNHFLGITNAAGDYETSLALPPGNYHMLARPGGGANYVVEAWEDYPCQHQACPILDTDPVTLQSGQVTPDIDFGLQPGATISGSLLPDHISRVVRIYDGTGGLHLDQIFLDQNESDWSFTNLAGGSYYLELSAIPSTEPYIRVLHNGLLCPFSGCDRARGVPITIPPRSSLGMDSITLNEGGQIEGTIVRGSDGQPPPTSGTGSLGTYNIIDSDGNVVGGGSIEVNGGNVELTRSAALPDGDYYVRTFGSWLGNGIGHNHPGWNGASIPGYADAMHPDVPCAGIGCDRSSATAVSVTQGNVTSITIEVDTGSRITGSIVDDDDDTPISDALIKLVDENNEMLAVTYTDSDGNFEFGAFPPGDYYLRTSMSGRPGFGYSRTWAHPYFDRVHGASDSCSEALCDPTDGTAITLDGGTDVGPFELRVEPGPVISGRILDGLTGLLINGGHVEVYNGAGELVGNYHVDGTTGRYQTTALEPGTYTLVPQVSPAFSQASTGSPTSPSLASTRSTRQQHSDGFTVTVESEDVEADLRVIDDGLDRIFEDAFRND